MSSVLPILLIGVGGFLLGGVWSLWKNDSKPGAIVLGCLAVGAIVGGVLWLLPS